jgi:hypothetical protein
MKKKTSKKVTSEKALDKVLIQSAKNKETAVSGRKVKRASKKILSAATHVKNTTKKIVDDVFLKVLGLRVLERAQEVTQNLHQEKKRRKGRK